MQFNDTTGLDGLIQDCERRTGLGTGRISGNATLLKDFTSRLNSATRKVVTMILQSQDEWGYDDSNHPDFPILTTDLVQGQQAYNLPDGIMKITRVEVSYDGSAWRRAEPFDIAASSDATDAASVARDFSTNAPFYDVAYGAFKLFPIPQADVAGGLRIWIYRDIDPFVSTDTTQAPGIDVAFHPLISIIASLDYCLDRSMAKKSKDLADLASDMEGRLRQYYNSKQADRQMNMVPAYLNYR